MVVFQSYQGSILSIILCLNKRDKEILSILSRFYFISGISFSFLQPGCLSILSRFYFITDFNNSIFTWTIILSILSRFYFIFDELASIIKEGTIFQSYQGSILSSDHIFTVRKRSSFQSYQGSILSGLDQWFNPNTKLSILSRFYFIRKRKRKIQHPKHTFNPIKVLFYQDS